MHPSRFDDSVVFAYVSRLSRDTGAVAKFGSVNPGNAALGLPTVHAVITALDPVTGELVAVMDGTAVTTLRTAAAGAVAFDALSTADSAELALIGSGTQALAHARADRPRTGPEGRTGLESHPGATRTGGGAARRRTRHRRRSDPHPSGGGDRACPGGGLHAQHHPVVRGAWLAPGCTVAQCGVVRADPQ